MYGASFKKLQQATATPSGFAGGIPSDAAISRPPRG
jgi:hypothetical protein